MLRALLTEEFLRIPERLDRIEAELAEAKTERTEIRAELAEAKTELAEAKTERAEMRAELDQAKTERARMSNDIGILKGDMLEVRLHRSVRPNVSQRLGLRRGRIMQSAVQETRSDFSDAVDDALVNNLITDEQENRIHATDIILRALRKSDGSRVWLAVEVSNSLGQRDIERTRQSADALSAVFDEESEAIVVGYSIHPRDRERADRLGVHAFIVPTPRLPSDSE